MRRGLSILKITTYFCEACNNAFMVGYITCMPDDSHWGVCRSCGLSVEAIFDWDRDIEMVQGSVEKGHFIHQPDLRHDLQQRIDKHRLGIPAHLSFRKEGSKPPDDLRDDLRLPQLCGEMVDCHPSLTCPVCHQEKSLVFEWDEEDNRCPKCGLDKLRVFSK